MSARHQRVNDLIRSFNQHVSKPERVVRFIEILEMACDLLATHDCSPYGIVHTAIHRLGLDPEVYGRILDGLTPYEQFDTAGDYRDRRIRTLINVKSRLEKGERWETMVRKNMLGSVQAMAHNPAFDLGLMK